MKRILSLLLCTAVLGGLTGCSGIGEPVRDVQGGTSSPSAENPSPPVSSNSSGETVQSSIPASETPWRYTVENPLEYDLAAALANFPRHLSLDELLSSLPNSSRVQDSQGNPVRQVQSGGWRFMGTEGALCATYMEDPESDGLLLSNLDYWTLNQDLDTFAHMLDEINALNLPGVENYEQRPLTLTNFYSSAQNSFFSIEEYSEPYLPADAHCYGISLLAEGADGKTFLIDCLYWGADKAEEFCPEILKADAPEILSGILIQLSYSTDVGV